MLAKVLVVILIFVGSDIAYADIRETRVCLAKHNGYPIRPDQKYFALDQGDIDPISGRWVPTPFTNPRGLSSPIRFCGWIMPAGVRGWVLVSTERKHLSSDDRRWIKSSDRIEPAAINGKRRIIHEH